MFEIKIFWHDFTYIPMRVMVSNFVCVEPCMIYNSVIHSFPYMCINLTHSCHMICVDEGVICNTACFVFRHAFDIITNAFQLKHNNMMVWNHMTRIWYCNLHMKLYVRYHIQYIVTRYCFIMHWVWNVAPRILYIGL